MKKKLYIQPTTDFVRTANGEPLMTPIDGGLSGSPSAGQPAPNRIGSNAPMHKINIMYI